MSTVAREEGNKRSQIVVMGIMAILTVLAMGIALAVTEEPQITNMILAVGGMLLLAIGLLVLRL